MDIKIVPQILSGSVSAIPSKSQAHRMLICAAFADRNTQIICPFSSQDIEATVSCLNAIGANIAKTEYGYFVEPVSAIPSDVTLDCNESGSTLRFMLPIAASLGINATFIMRGRLPHRPLSPLWEELERMGCRLSRPTEDTISCQGQLENGIYHISGNISSQFITGLLFALSLLPGNSQLNITGKIESKPYVNMTIHALSVFGQNVCNFCIQSDGKFHSPSTVTIEGDWSNAAFFLAGAAIGNQLTINGLDSHSKQGDKVIAEHLRHLENYTTISGEDCPDIIPILAVVAACKKGARFTNISRLRLKESDRIAAITEMLNAFGITAQVIDDDLLISPGLFHACTIDSKKDHRIAMAAAIASTVADGPIVILNAECVNKSYPDFWNEFTRLGGHYEQCTR